MSIYNKISFSVLLVLIILGWYGGIDYNERSSFNSAYVLASWIISQLATLAYNENKGDKGE